MQSPLADGTIVYLDEDFTVIAEEYSLGVYSEQSHRYEVMLRLSSPTLARSLIALNFPYKVGTNSVLDAFFRSVPFAEHMATFFHTVPEDSTAAREAEERALRIREVLQRLKGSTDVGPGALISLVRQTVTSSRFLFIGSMWDNAQPHDFVGWNFHCIHWPIEQNEIPPKLEAYFDDRGTDVVVVIDLTEAGAARARSVLELVVSRGGTVLPVWTTGRSLIVGPTLFPCDTWNIQGLLEGFPTEILRPLLPTWGQRIAMGLVESELPFTLRRIVEAQKRDITLAVGSMFCLDLRSMAGHQVEMLPGVRTNSIPVVAKQIEQLLTQE